MSATARPRSVVPSAPARATDSAGPSWTRATLGFTLSLTLVSVLAFGLAAV